LYGPHLLGSSSGSNISQWQLAHLLYFISLRFFDQLNPEQKTAFHFYKSQVRCDLVFDGAT
jgi:hypothetical protein